MGTKQITTEEIIVLFLKDPRLVDSTLKCVECEATDELRELICDLGDARIAYRYAQCVDKKSHELTRKVAVKDPETAFWYAKNIDKKPHRDTWKGVYRDRYYAREYMAWERWYECNSKWRNSLKKKK